MDAQRKVYPDDHWLKSRDPEKVLAAYLEQQDKTYSRIKNGYIRELMGDLQGKRVLDYGCGPGLFTVHAAQAGAAHVVGVDAEETALSAAQLFARMEGVEKSCSFIRSDRFPSSLGRAQFDVVLLKDVIEHVPDDQGLLNAAAQAIVPAGRLVLSTQNALSLNFLLQGMYRRVLRGDKNWYGWDPTHLRFYTPMSLDYKLKDAGFRSVGWRSVYIVPYKLPAPPGSEKEFLRIDALSWIDKRLGGVFPYNRLGWNVIVAAEASPFVTRRVPERETVTKGLPPEPVLLTRESVR